MFHKSLALLPAHTAPVQAGCVATALPLNSCQVPLLGFCEEPGALMGMVTRMSWNDMQRKLLLVSLRSHI